MTRVLLLCKSEDAYGLQQGLENKGAEVCPYHSPLTVEVLEAIDPDWVISHNYPYIVPEEVICARQGRILNLHSSLLPWNRGASPNLWSILEDTPKGVSIHQMEKGLDTGPILWQKEIYFGSGESLASSYRRLNQELADLLLENWENLLEGLYTPRVQEGRGSYHRKRDLDRLLAGRELDYSMRMEDFKAWVWGGACRAPEEHPTAPGEHPTAPGEERGGPETHGVREAKAP